MNKLVKIINEMDSDDLVMIKKDLESGNITKVIQERIRQIKEKDYNKVCPVCHSPIQESSLTLLFGPCDMRKRASFCALDCLEYFISRIKENKGEE